MTRLEGENELVGEGWCDVDAGGACLLCYLDLFSFLPVLTSMYLVTATRFRVTYASVPHTVQTNAYVLTHFVLERTLSGVTLIRFGQTAGSEGTACRIVDKRAAVSSCDPQLV